MDPSADRRLQGTLTQEVMKFTLDLDLIVVGKTRDGR